MIISDIDYEKSCIITEYCEECREETEHYIGIDYVNLPYDPEDGHFQYYKCSKCGNEIGPFL